MWAEGLVTSPDRASALVCCAAALSHLKPQTLWVIAYSYVFGCLNISLINLDSRESLAIVDFKIAAN